MLVWAGSAVAARLPAGGPAPRQLPTAWRRAALCPPAGQPGMVTRAQDGVCQAADQALGLCRDGGLSAARGACGAAATSFAPLFAAVISSPHRCMRPRKARVRLGWRRRTERPATGAHEGNTKCERQVVVQNEEKARPGGRLEAGVAKWHKSGAWWHKTSGQQNAVLWRQESRPGRQSLVRERRHRCG